MTTDAAIETTPEVTPVEAPVTPEVEAPVDVVEPTAPEITEDAPIAASEPMVIQSLDELFEQHPHLREDYDARLKVRENAAAQRREAEMRRKAGTLENTRAQVSRWIDTAVAPLLTEAGLDPTSLKSNTQALDFMYSLARESSARELAEALPQVFMSGFDLTPEQKLEALEARDEMVTLPDGQQVPNYDAYVGKLISSAIQNRMGTLKLADIPEASPLRREIRTEAQRIAAAEIQAARIQAAPKVDAPPVPPAGAPVGTSGRIENTRSADAAYNRGEITSAQLRGFYTQFGEPFPFD